MKTGTEYLNVNTNKTVWYRNYKYSFFDREHGGKVQVRCAKKLTHGCKAHVTVESATNKVIFEGVKHNHPLPDPATIKFDGPFNYENITLTNGRKLILYQNYTYHRTWTPLSYQCSKKSSINCPAKVRLGATGQIEYAETEHNHPPPKLIKCSSGEYRRCNLD